jgi:hypothetical protein
VLRSISTLPKLGDNCIPVGKTFASAFVTTASTVVCILVSGPTIIIILPSIAIANVPRVRLNSSPTRSTFASASIISFPKVVFSLLL